MVGERSVIQGKSATIPASTPAASMRPFNIPRPLTDNPDTSRDDWKPRPFNQFVDGPVEGDLGVRRTLEMTLASVVA